MFGYKPNNFMKVACRIPFHSAYLYIDTMDYLDNGTFAKRKIPIRYNRHELKINGGPYIIRLCTIPTRCEPGFEEVMDIILCNAKAKYYPDYQTVCNHMAHVMQRHQEEDVRKRFWERPWYKILKEIG